MSQLETLQNELKKLLFVHDEEATASPLWKDGLPKRLSVYRNNVQTNWIDTLEHDFAMTRKQFADSDWQRLRSAYFAKNPPRHWELNTSIAPFPRFLKAQKVKQYVKELADYEWNDLQIFIDRSTVKRGLGVTNPTARASVFQHQIFNWVEDGAPADAPPLQKPEVLVFYRDTRNTCHIREADPLMLLLMDHFRIAGASLEAVEPIRRKLLPDNKIPLSAVQDSLRQMDLLL